MRKRVRLGVQKGRNNCRGMRDHRRKLKMESNGGGAVEYNPSDEGSRNGVLWIVK